MDVVKKAYLNQLFESSLSRMKEYADNRNFGIVSAHRSELTPEENEQRTQELESAIRGLGYGFVKAIGHYVENKGEPTEKQAKENSFIVGGRKEDDGGKLLTDLKELGKRYNQESILHKPHDTNVASLHILRDTFDNKEGDSFPIGNYAPDASALIRGADNQVVGRAFTQLVNGSHAGRVFSYTSPEDKERNLILKECVAVQLLVPRTNLNREGIF